MEPVPPPAPDSPPALRPASLVVIDPNGHRTRVPIEPLPLLIGRQSGSHVIIRDSRVSREHARIVAENGEYVIEDCGSRHGTFVNGRRIEGRQALRDSDTIDFGAQDSYKLLFAADGAELKRLMEQMGASEKAAPAPGAGGNLAKLRAILDLARTCRVRFRWMTCLPRWWMPRSPSPGPSAAS